MMAQMEGDEKIVQNIWDSKDLWEVLNGIWFMVSLVLVGVFGTFLVWRSWRWVRQTYPDEPLWRSLWYQATAVVLGRGIENQAVFFLMLYFVGSSVYRVITWVLLLGGDTISLTAYHAGLVFGTGLALVAALGMIRTFTPERWNPWLWVSAGSVSVAVPVIVHIVT